MPTRNPNRLHLRAIGLAHLQVTEEHLRASSSITPSLRMISKTMKGNGDRGQHKLPYGMGANLLASWPQYLKMSGDPDALKILGAWADTSSHVRTHVPIEAYCLAAGVSPLRALEIITAACVRVSAMSSSIIAAVNHPRVVEKTVEMALTDDGFDDRKILHQATGFLPSAKAPSQVVNVHTSASATAQAAAVAPAAPESTIRRMVDRFNDARGAQPALPPTSAVELPTIEGELIAVESSSSDEDE